MLHVMFANMVLPYLGMRERENGSDECVKSEAIRIKTVKTCHYRITFYSLKPGSITLMLGVERATRTRSTNAEKSFQNPGRQRNGGSCTLTSPSAFSGVSMDDIAQALHSLGKQNNGIENKIELQGLKIESQVQDILLRFDKLCISINAQSTQLIKALKLHEDKLSVKVNAFGGRIHKKGVLSRFYTRSIRRTS